MNPPKDIAGGANVRVLDCVYERRGYLKFAPSRRRVLLNDDWGVFFVDPMMGPDEQFDFINSSYAVKPTEIQELSKIKARIRSSIVLEFRQAVSRVFEVSAYDGLTLKVFADAFGAQCFGIEPTTAAVEFAKKFFPESSANIYNDVFENIERYPAFAEKFDAFIFSYSFQHLNDPQACLAKCAKMMRQGGLLIIDEGVLIDDLTTREWPFLIRNLHSSKSYYLNSHVVKYMAGRAGFKFKNYLRLIDERLPHYSGLVFEYVGGDLSRPIDLVTSRIVGRSVFDLYQSLPLSPESKIKVLEMNYPDFGSLPAPDQM